jgi:hypothetical protein
MNEKDAFRKFREESQKAMEVAGKLQREFEGIQQAASNISMPISKRAAKLQGSSLPADKQKYLKILGRDCFESAKNLMIDYFRREGFCNHEISYARKNF